MLPLGRVPAALHQLGNRPARKRHGQKKKFRHLLSHRVLIIIVCTFYRVTSNSQCLISLSEERPRHLVSLSFTPCWIHTVCPTEISFSFFSCGMQVQVQVQVQMQIFSLLGLTRHPPDKAFVFWGTRNRIDKGGKMSQCRTLGKASHLSNLSRTIYFSPP